MQNTFIAFPLFKGATRIPTVFSVPIIPLFSMLIIIAIIAMSVSLLCWLIAPIGWFVMAAITKHDDRAFRIWGLWFETNWRNGNGSIWQASSYSKSNYNKKSVRLWLK